MKAAPTSCVLILIAAVAAIGVRTLNLSQRPMHVDEAVHADKFRDLLENGRYVYNPHEYHGPSLNYATIVPALLSGAGTYSSSNRIDAADRSGCFRWIIDPSAGGVAGWSGAVGVVFAGVFTTYQL
jgi:hypothetical protein